MVAQLWMLLWIEVVGGGVLSRSDCIWSSVVQGMATAWARLVFGSASMMEAQRSNRVVYPSINEGAYGNILGSGKSGLKAL